MTFYPAFCGPKAHPQKRLTEIQNIENYKITKDVKAMNLCNICSTNEPNKKPAEIALSAHDIENPSMMESGRLQRGGIPQEQGHHRESSPLGAHQPHFSSWWQHPESLPDDGAQHT